MKSGETGSITAYGEVYSDLFRDNYVVMQYNFVQFLTEHMTDVSRVFEADLQSVLILGVVGQTELSGRIQGNFPTPLKRTSKRAAGINASSIADVTGIPRETVRRKLEGLAQRGWLDRDERGLWRIAVGPDGAAARRDLTDLDKRGMKRVSRFLGLMHVLAIEQERKSQEQPALGPPPAGPLLESGSTPKVGAYSVDATKSSGRHRAQGTAASARGQISN